MNEFKKPYEYLEEKRSGAILLFVISLLSIDMFITLFYTSLVSGHYMRIPALGISYLTFSILYLLFTLFTAVICFRMNRHMLVLAKAYLLVRAVYMICSMALLFMNAINDKGMIGKGKEYSSVFQMTFSVLLLPLAYLAVITIGWYLYFKKSKKFKETMKSILGK